MSYKKKSWAEKLEDKPTLPKVLEFDPQFPCGKALVKLGAEKGDSVVLPNAKEVQAIMRAVPKGKLITIKEVCETLSRKHRTKYCCTLVTGIEVMIVGNASEEIKDGIPYWRTLKMNGVLNEKYPGGTEAQRQMLEKEGFEIERRGGKFRVVDFERYLTPC